MEHVLQAASYAEFKTALAESACAACRLSEKRTRIVVDRGNPKAKILVIGEAPGETEDRLGRAFVGRAGKLFDQVMAGIGLNTEQDMLICNVVKCRPPDNRRPKEDEAAACRPFLLKQIGLVDPKVVVLLGATALKHLDPARGKFSMAEETGKLFILPEFPDARFMVLYHPAALLYNQKLKPAMLEHAAGLKKILDHGFETQTD